MLECIFWLFQVLSIVFAAAEICESPNLLLQFLLFNSSIILAVMHIEPLDLQCMIITHRYIQLSFFSHFGYGQMYIHSGKAFVIVSIVRSICISKKWDHTNILCRLMMVTPFFQS